MSTYDERSLTDADGHLMRLYCRSCNRFFLGLFGDKECQVCLGFVTPEYQPSDLEMMDWLDVQRKRSPDILLLPWCNAQQTAREAIRNAMKAEQSAAAGKEAGS